MAEIGGHSRLTLSGHRGVWYAATVQQHSAGESVTHRRQSAQQGQAWIQEETRQRGGARPGLRLLLSALDYRKSPGLRENM